MIYQAPEGGDWWCQILYSRTFSREDNPRLAEILEPFVSRFRELLLTPDLLLFICHASEDKEFVDWLASYLDSRDVALWYDKREIRVGDSIVARVSEGLEAASHLIVVLSRASVAKPWVQREFSSTLMRQLKDRAIAVIPLLREDCPIPPLLCDIKYADCRLDADAGFQQLMEPTAHSTGFVVVSQKTKLFRDRAGNNFILVTAYQYGCLIIPSQ